MKASAKDYQTVYLNMHGKRKHTMPDSAIFLPYRRKVRISYANFSSEFLLQGLMTLQLPKMLATSPGIALLKLLQLH
jgi:hypothetical protein